MARAGGAVPLRQLVILIYVLQAAGGHGLPEILVHGGVGIITAVAPACADGVGGGHEIEFHGGMVAPAEDIGFAVEELLDIRVGGAAGDHVDAQVFRLLGHRHGHHLPVAHGGGVIQGELGLLAVLLPDAVAVRIHPAGVLQDPLGHFGAGIGFIQRGLLIEPGHQVAHGAGGLAEAVEHVVAQLFPVDPQADGLPDRHVTGHIVADLLAVRRGLPLVGHRAEDDAEVVDGLHIYKMITGDGLGGQGLVGIDDVHVAPLGGSEGCVLIHKDQHDTLDGGFRAVIELVVFPDGLLALVPADHFVGAGADGVFTVIVAVTRFRHDAQLGDLINKGVVRLRQGEFHRMLILGFRADHVGQIQVAAAGLGLIEGESGVGSLDLFAVGEVGVVADGEAPYLPAFVHAVIRRQIVGDDAVPGLHQAALQDRVIAQAVALDGVVAGGDLRGDGGDDLVLHRGRGRLAAARGRVVGGGVAGGGGLIAAGGGLGRRLGRRRGISTLRAAAGRQGQADAKDQQDAEDLLHAVILPFFLLLTITRPLVGAGICRTRKTPVSLIRDRRQASHVHNHAHDLVPRLLNSNSETPSPMYLTWLPSESRTVPVASVLTRFHVAIEGRRRSYCMYFI